MPRGYFREIRGLPLAKQHELADAAKIAKGARYEEGKSTGWREREAAIKSCRAGDVGALWVADLAVLANNRNDLADVLAVLTERKIDLIEGRTGLMSRAHHDGARMVQNVYRYWSKASKTFGNETVVEAGRRGGLAAAGRHSEGRMPEKAAGAIWHGRRYAHMTNDEVLDEINADERYEKPWAMATLYRKFGPRRRPSKPIE